MCTARTVRKTKLAEYLALHREHAAAVSAGLGERTAKLEQNLHKRAKAYASPGDLEVTARNTSRVARRV